MIACGLDFGTSNSAIGVARRRATRRRQPWHAVRRTAVLTLAAAAATVAAAPIWYALRGGFDEFFKPEQIYEVDCPGLTSPVLANFTWTKLPRPVYPLDEETSWTPPTGV